MSDQSPQDKVDAVIAQRKEKGDALRSMLTKCTSELQAALPQGAMAEQFVRILMTTVQKTPRLMECSQRSIVVGAFEAAALGLTIDGVLGHAYLVPYRVRGAQEAQLQVGYKGYIRLAHNAGVRLRGGAVRVNDWCEYEEGTAGYVRHRKLTVGHRGELLLAYAWSAPYEYPDARDVIVLTEGEVMQRRGVSKTAGRDDSAWNTWPSAMWTKTAIRAMASQVPQSSQLQRIASADEQRELGVGGRVDIVDVEIPEVG